MEVGKRVKNKEEAFQVRKKAKVGLFLKLILIFMKVTKKLKKKVLLN